MGRLRQPAINLPRFVEPMLAEAHAAPPRGEGWAFEFKWDGVRAIAAWDGETLTLHSRRGNRVTQRYPELHGLGDLIGGREAVLDVEIVSLDDRGRPNFGRIQHRIHASGDAKIRAAARRYPAIAMAFDVLWLDGASLMSRPYLERREVLAGLDLCDDHWQTPPHHLGNGAAMFRAATQHGLEGLVAKRTDSTYEPGARTGAWRKVRVSKRQEFVIGGYTIGEGRRKGTIGAILVGYHDRRGLRYAGKVGTGFKDRDLKMLVERFAACAASPFVDDTGQRGARFVEPTLVAEIKFTEWTKDNILRHPSYQGLREDKDPRAVVRET